MTTPLFLHLSSIICIVLSLVVISLSLRSREKIGRMYYYLVGSEVSILVWAIMTYVQIGLLERTNVIMWYAIVGNVGIMIGLFLAVLFVNSLLNESISHFTISYFTLLTGANFGIYIAGWTLNDPNLVDITYFNLINVFNSIFTLSIGGKLVTDIVRLRRQLSNPKRRSQISWFLYSVVIGLGGMFGVGILVVSVDPIFQLYGTIWVSFAFVAFIIAYTKDTDIAYFVPSRSYLFVLANRYGTPLYSKDFAKDEVENEITFISGVIKATSSMMSEHYNSEVNPISFKFSSKIVLIEWRAEFFLAVITERNSWVIRRALHNIADTLEELDINFDLYRPQANDKVIEEIIEKEFFFTID